MQFQFTTCACGCGTFIPGIDKRNRPREFSKGHHIYKIRSPLVKRFWNMVIKSTECWEWQGYHNHKGYGKINVAGKIVLAHRVSWELHFGTILTDLNVLHSCDNPPCVRPNHLFLGTIADNNQDMLMKGRANHHGMAKLTAAQVTEIRTLRAAGVMCKVLSRQYNVSYQTIYAVVTRRHWASIP